jgi:hypothetical protein
VSTTQVQTARSQPHSLDVTAETKKEHVHRESRTTALEQKRTETLKGNTVVTRGAAGVSSVASTQSKATITDKKQTLNQLKEQRCVEERKRVETRSTPWPATPAPQSYSQTKSQGQNQTKPTQAQQKIAVPTAGQSKQTQSSQQVQTQPVQQKQQSQQQVQPHSVQQKHSHPKIGHQMSASNFVQQHQHRSHTGSFIQQPVEWTEFTGDPRVMAQKPTIGFVPGSQSSQTLPTSQSVQTMHPQPVLNPSVQKSTLDEFDPLSQGNP